jgi:fucose 4-O-acetylase-like acetyltransferase
MTSMARDSLGLVPDLASRTIASSRDAGIDTMRGLAILMVIGGHSLQQPLNSWETPVDALVRAAVPIFLFTSGYLTALSERVLLWKRLKATLIPYAIAFVAAYIYMALHNPAMDHRVTTTVARFVLAYVFVYYYVFVYVGCTIVLWLVLSASGTGTTDSERRLVVLLLLSIVLGMIVGSYLDPLLFRQGFSDSLVEEVRMRDIPFWFSFMALGALIGLAKKRASLDGMLALISSAALFAYIIYAAVRLFGLGDAADFESVAYFGYGASICILLLVLDIQLPLFAALGSGSYFIYLWHILIIMTLRDHAELRQFGPLANSTITFAVTGIGTVLALLAVRALMPRQVCRWLGA